MESKLSLNTLSSPEGSRHSKKRLGRGSGSGLGKTSGRGHKGQLSRSGGGKGPGFEGGQMPLQRRIPKRGFVNSRKKKWITFNVADLAKLETGTISPELLKEKGLVRGKYHGIKILGDGDLSTALTVKAHAFSQGAKEKIESAGGSIEVIEK